MVNKLIPFSLFSAVLFLSGCGIKPVALPVLDDDRFQFICLTHPTYCGRASAPSATRPVHVRISRGDHV